MCVCVRVSCVRVLVSMSLTHMDTHAQPRDANCEAQTAAFIFFGLLYFCARDTSRPATHCNIGAATHYWIGTATHCNTLQHTATHCNTECFLVHVIRVVVQHIATQALQHTTR